MAEPQKLVRVRFSCKRLHPYLLSTESDEIRKLEDLVAEMERLGAAPIAPDGLVAGNCAMRYDHYKASKGGEAAAPLQQQQQQHEDAVLVSRSGRPSEHKLAPEDLVHVVSFDRAAWEADFDSASSDIKPSSDTPLLYSALHDGVKERYGWRDIPNVALHGHTLADEDGVAAALALGFPVSDQATTFSTPDDLEQLELLFKAHPYPENKVYIRRGHGFFLLGKDVDEVAAVFHGKVCPYLLDRSWRDNHNHSRS